MTYKRRTVRSIILGFSVQKVKSPSLAPTQSDIQFDLTAGEKSAGLPSGAISWLISGFSIEEDQYVISLHYKQ